MIPADLPSIAILCDLLEKCRESEGGFREAALSVGDARLRTLFQSYSQQRGQLAEELQQEIARLRGIPVAPLGGPARSAQVWSKLPSVQDDRATLELCRRSIEQDLLAYAETLALELEPQTRQIVSRQRSAVSAARDRIGELMDQ